MGFSDTMRESLGVEGARVEIEGDGAGAPRGGVARAVVRVAGGTRPATIDGLVLRLIEAHRHWSNPTGAAISDEDAQALADRSHLMPVWTRKTVSEARIEVGQTVESGGVRELAVELAVPASCGVTTPACVVMLHAQADIKGQIDPTATAQLVVV